MFNSRFYEDCLRLAFHLIIDACHLISWQIINIITSFVYLIFQEQAPHIFCAAEKAFSAMSSGVGFANQSIIVSGESGAGKVCLSVTLVKWQNPDQTFLIKLL